MVPWEVICRPIKMGEAGGVVPIIMNLVLLTLRQVDS